MLLLSLFFFMYENWTDHCWKIFFLSIYQEVLVRYRCNFVGSKVKCRINSQQWIFCGITTKLVNVIQLPFRSQNTKWHCPNLHILDKHGAIIEWQVPRVIVSPLTRNIFVTAFIYNFLISCYIRNLLPTAWNLTYDLTMAIHVIR